MSNRKKWSSSEKFKIVIEAIKGEKTLNELCRHYKVAPSQVHVWRKQFLEHGQQIFAKENKTASKEAVASDRLQGELYAKIGQLTIEKDYLKKSWEKYQGIYGGT